MKDLILRPRAEFDVADAALWYESQRGGASPEVMLLPAKPTIVMMTTST